MGDCNDQNDAVFTGATEIPNNGIDDNCDGVVDSGSFDNDGDGWLVEAGDCDDTTADVFPSANEVADGIDNNCDGNIDEGTELYDDDGDGLSEAEGDCDDSDAAVNPNSTEQANGVDDNCDGQVDEDTERTDDDGDGWTELGGDCDDDDNNVHPFNEDDPFNGIDDDCDGDIDEDPIDLDGDGFGVNDCDDTDGWINPGASDLKSPSGCGCNSVTGNTGTLPWLLAGILLFGGRRRS